MNRLGLGLVAFIVVLVVGVLAYETWRVREATKPIAKDLPADSSRIEKAQEIPPREFPEDYVEVGGIKRPKRDVERQVKSATDVNSSLPKAGIVPRIPKNENASTRSVAEAFDNPELAHRLSAMIPPPPFDLDKYRESPEEYQNTIEPGRVNQYLPYSEEVAPIRRVSTYFQEVLQGETVVLEAKVNEDYPVTFYSNRLGMFQNKLPTITVAPDDQGIARAEFLVSKGTRDEVEVLAASPMHSGQARFLVKVVLPKDSP
jgi:hypothetical protein